MTPKVTGDWLKDARYEYYPESVLPVLDVFLPNSATSKQQRYRGKDQCDLVRCLLDALGVAGETKT